MPFSEATEKEFNTTYNLEEKLVLADRDEKGSLFMAIMPKGM